MDLDKTDFIPLTISLILIVFMFYKIFTNSKFILSIKKSNEIRRKKVIMDNKDALSAIEFLKKGC